MCEKPPAGGFFVQCADASGYALCGGEVAGLAVEGCARLRLEQFDCCGKGLLAAVDRYAGGAGCLAVYA